MAGMVNAVQKKQCLDKNTDNKEEAERLNITDYPLTQ